MSKYWLIHTLFFLCLNGSTIIDSFAHENDVQSGIIAPTSGNCPPERLCFPESEINLYSEAKELVIGSARTQNRFDLSIDIKASLIQPLLNSLTWHSELSYDSNALEFSRLDGEYLLLAEIDGKEFFFKKSELEQNGYTAFLWPDFLTKYQGLIVPNQLLNLRKEPHRLASKVAVLNLYSHIEFTGKFEKEWAEVQVKLYKDESCDDAFSAVKNVTGWIKYFDGKEDQPNLILGGSC